MTENSHALDSSSRNSSPVARVPPIQKQQPMHDSGFQKEERLGAETQSCSIRNEVALEDMQSFDTEEFQLHLGLYLDNSV